MLMSTDVAAAVQMVMRMDAPLLVNRDARQKQMTVEDRLASRRQHLEEWAEEIRQECVKLSPSVLPKSALGKAVGYTLNMWPKLRRIFDYAEVELSNNPAELDATDRAGAGRTGCTSAAPKQGRRSPRSSQWWNPAVGCACPCGNICWMFCPASMAASSPKLPGSRRRTGRLGEPDSPDSLSLTCRETRSVNSRCECAGAGND
jgi:Transposase IS66 family